MPDGVRWRPDRREPSQPGPDSFLAMEERLATEARAMNGDEESAERFGRAIAAIDAVNAEDPNRVEFAGTARPKELLHAERASHWLEILEPQAGEALRLAVRAHHLRRWALPRAEYPAGRAGYHAWRRQLQDRHAREAGELMVAAGYDEAMVDRVAELIRKRARDDEAQVFEDVLCLVFVEMQLESFAAAHEPDKVVEILARTLPKMSERAIGIAAGLSASPVTDSLLERAVARAGR